MILPHASATDLGENDLTSILHYYQNLKSLQVPFTQTKTMRNLDMTLTSSGILKVQKNPQKIIWDILKPAAVRVVLTPNQVQIINDPGKKTEQVQTLKMDALPTNQASADPKNFAALADWLDLDAKALARDYRIEKRSNTLYEFTPKEKGKTPFVKLEMTLHPPGPLEKLTIHELSEDEIEIRFGKP